MNKNKLYRMTVYFSPDEHEALNKMCDDEFRLLDGQVRWCVVEELKKRGYLRDPQAQPLMAPAKTPKDPSSKLRVYELDGDGKPVPVLVDIGDND